MINATIHHLMGLHVFDERAVWIFDYLPVTCLGISQLALTMPRATSFTKTNNRLD